MNLRQDARVKNLKRWKAQSPALTVSPLKAIHNAFPDERLPGGGSIEHKTYTKARRAAARGDGAAVKAIARASIPA